MLGLGSTIAGDSSMFLLDKLDGLTDELGMRIFTESNKSLIDMFFITAALMAGTAGLPHVIVRFFTVPRVRDARISAAYALVFIALLYTTAPAVAAFARINIIESIDSVSYSSCPSGLSVGKKLAYSLGSTRMEMEMFQYRGGALPSTPSKPMYSDKRGVNGERELINRRDFRT